VPDLRGDADLPTALPLRHVSIRVPWHDRAWDGHVCDPPPENSACLALPPICESRVDSTESRIAGIKLGGPMPSRAYRKRWEAKKVWYRTQGVLPHEEGGGENRALIETMDSKAGGISAAKIKSLTGEFLYSVTRRTEQ
jgi:hypothetical protein